jgi:hypothetical protein
MYFCDRCFMKIEAFLARDGFNPLMPNDLQRCRAVSPLKIKIPSENLGRQRCAEGFNSGVTGLNR